MMQQLLTGQTRLPGFRGEWKVTRLGEIASIRNQKVLPSNVGIDTLCVELDHIGQGNGKLLEYSTAQDSTSIKYRFFSGDVLFGRLRSYLRKFWLADRDGICTTEIWPLMTDSKQAYSGFLHAIVQSDRFIEAASISYGTHMPRADWGVMRTLEVRLPRVCEQQAIAAVLSDLDNELAALEARRDKTRDLKRAMMQQLLTGQTRLPGFRGEWKVTRLGDCVTFLRNGVNSRAELLLEGRVKYVHYGDVHACKDVYLSTDSLPCLPDAKAASLDRLLPGDLIFVDASEDLGGVGKSVEVREVGSTEVVSGLHTIAARFDKGVLADGFKGFLQFCLPFVTRLRRLAAGTKVYATNRAHIAGVEMPLPPVREQAAIATVLSDMDAAIAALEARRDKTRDLKQAMMQELLTGKTRPAQPEEAHA